MGKRGPKPKPPEQLRRHPFSGRLTDAEYKRLIAMAKERSMTIPQLCRSVMFGYRLPPRRMPEVNAAEWVRLGKLANNLNQMVRLVHSGVLNTVDDVLLERILDELRTLREALKGGGSDGSQSDQ